MKIYSTAELHTIFLKSDGVNIDTRKLKDNEIFFAIKGPNFDGHNFVKKALEGGASYVVVENPEFLLSDQCLLVKDVEKALQNLAKYHRLTLTFPIIGLTGSNGKTTTKELINSVLSQKYNTIATEGNLNNHLGVPLSILKITKEHEIAIIEMGANHLGEIAFLSAIAMPDIGLITNIGKAHLEGFGSIDGVRKGKTELYEYLKSTNGIIFYNPQDENLEISLPKNIKSIKYVDKIIETKAFPTISFIYNENEIHANLYGNYNLLNIRAAITLGEYFGLEQNQIKKGIEDYNPENNRSQFLDSESNTLILDAYNANPSSMVLSVENLASQDIQGKCLILGHMLELGEVSKSEHENLIQLIDQSKWDFVMLIGSEFEDITIPKYFHHFTTTNEAKSYLENVKLKDKFILLKGSRGAKLEQLIPAL